MKGNPQPLRRGWIPVTVLLAVFAVFIGWHFVPIAAGADSGGYLNSAKLLAAGHLHGELRRLPEWPLSEGSPFTYVPLGFIDVQRTGQLTPSYPVGLPLHYALAGKLLGWEWGTTVIGVLGALLAVFATYACLREFDVGPCTATAVALTFAASPMLWFTSLVPLSDTLACAWCATAVLLALRARRNRWFAVGAGLAFSIAVLVRPTNALLGPVLLLILWDGRSLLLGAGGAVPLLGFGAWYNHALYGSAFATGYGAVDDLFQLRFLAPALRNYVTALPGVLPFAVVALLLLPILPWQRRRRELVALWLWFMAFAGFYSVYLYTGEYWWYLRFILPAFPALVVLGGVGLTRLTDRLATRGRPRAGRLAIVLVVVAALGVSLEWSRRHHVLTFPEEQRPHREIPLWARAHLPAHAAVLCFHLSSGFYFYTDFTVVRSDQFTPEEFARFATAVKKSGRPVYAAIFHFQDTVAFHDNIPGSWRKVADVADAGIWQLEP